MARQKPQAYLTIAVMVLAGLLMFTMMGNAGSLEPDGPPAPSMKSLNEIYQAIMNTNPPEPEPPAPSMFIKFDGVDGESKDENHEKWCDLLAFNQPIHRPFADGATGASRQRGDVILDDVVCVKEIDKSSPKLAEAVCKGTVYPKVEIHVTASYTDAGRVTYYAFELKNVQVVSYNISGHGQSDDLPVEEMSMNFEEIKVTYTEFDDEGKSKGNIEYVWKVDTGPA